MSIVKQSKYYVGYMDILGYKDFFEKHEDDTENFLNTIEEAFNEAIEEMRSYEKTSYYTEFKPIIKVFSDNILIALKCKYKNIDNYFPYMRLVILMANIQLRFITKYELILRGSIAKGMFYLNENMVFGKALITAYEMEQKAGFPKIILEKSEVNEILKYINSNPKDFPERAMALAACVTTAIAQDGDGSHFINYLSEYLKFVNSNNIQLSNFFSLKYKKPSVESEILTELRKDTPESIEKLAQLGIHKDVLIRKINEYGNYDDLLKGTWNIKDVEVRRSVLLKYMWVVDYHNKVCELMGLEERKINCTIRTDPQTHQPFVEVLA